MHKKRLVGEFVGEELEEVQVKGDNLYNGDSNYITGKKEEEEEARREVAVSAYIPISITRGRETRGGGAYSSSYATTPSPLARILTIDGTEISPATCGIFAIIFVFSIGVLLAIYFFGILPASAQT